jgi:hypothetical protein
MVNSALIEQELAAAEVAWKDGNEGKARVCARRAVALVTEAWLAGLTNPLWRGLRESKFVSFSGMRRSRFPSARRRNV